MKTIQTKKLFFSTLLIFLGSVIQSQVITGAWRGRIDNVKVELKLIKNGDSLLGTSYYYTNPSQYKRYSVRGYFDPETNDVIWWDDALLEDQEESKILGSGPDAQLAVADFNCPGSEELYLDGSSNLKDEKDSRKEPLHLQKMATSQFPDEWDYVLENYLTGANDPRLIDSIAHMKKAPPLMPDEEILAASPPAARPANAPEATSPAVSAPGRIKPGEVPEAAPSKTTNENKFKSRKKVLQTVIPVTAKTIELRFYDNAQIDGDSIALFLNNRMIFEHIFLTDKPYTVKINADELGDDNELVMVAENLGSIPPNTSYMVAIVGKKRYEARLFANEHSSALVRLVKPAPKTEAP